MLVSDRIADVLINEVGDFNHGFTYSGHPVCAAAALENLRIIEEEKLVERVRDDIGPYFAKRWGALAEHDFVGQAESVGLMGGLQLAADKKTRTRFEKPDPIGSAGAQSRARKRPRAARHRRPHAGLATARHQP